jgi:hypothetical protein
MTSAIKNICLFVLILSAFRQANTQTAAQHPATHIAFSRVPLWPTDGDPSHYPDHYVFLDAQTGDLVVSYPTNLGTDATQNTGSQNTFRVHLPNHVQPFVAARVRKTPQGEFEYTYRVRNGRFGRDAITAWHLDVSSLRDVVVDHQDWGHSTSARVPGSEQYRSVAPGSHQIHWSLSSSDGNGTAPKPGASPIVPGSVLGKFSVRTASKPGFVWAHFEGGSVVSESTQTLPAAVAQQLAKETELAHSSRVAYTLGPKFEPETTQLEVVTALWSDLNQLFTRRLLSRDSPYATEVAAYLQGYLKSYSQSGSLPGTFVAPPLNITNKPTTQVEKQLATVLKLSL